MHDAISFDVNTAESAQVQALAEQCLSAIRESNERAKQSEGEIDVLQAETRALLDQLRTQLDVETTR